MNYDYLAGIVDGEGTISFMATKRRRGVTYRPYLSVSNTDVRLLNAVRAFLGVGHVFKLTDGTNAHLPSRAYRLMGPALKPVLLALEPRLLLKVEQARLVIAWLEARSSQHTRAYRPEDHALVVQTRLLNAKGPKITREVIH